MRYLEKYVFDFIPDFSQIPEAINMFKNNEIDLYKLFNITDEERKYIKNYYKIKYNFF